METPHPGAHTLSIASTQRVESENSSLKQMLQRSGTMVDVDWVIVGKVQDDAIKTERKAIVALCLFYGRLTIFLRTTASKLNRSCP